MAKYSYEFKKKVVMDYINGKGGYEYLSKEYEILLPLFTQLAVQTFPVDQKRGLVGRTPYPNQALR